MFLLSNFAGHELWLKFEIQISNSHKMSFSFLYLQPLILSSFTTLFVIFFPLFRGKPFSIHRELFFFSLLHVYSLMFFVPLFFFSLFLVQASIESPRWGPFYRHSGSSLLRWVFFFNYFLSFYIYSYFWHIPLFFLFCVRDWRKITSSSVVVKLFQFTSFSVDVYNSKYQAFIFIF